MSPTFRFIPAMYRAAVVDRIKTQTRRVITPQPLGVLLEPDSEGFRKIEELTRNEDSLLSKATYGPPGTVLPVVTTWAVNLTLDRFKPREFSVMNHTHIWWNDGSPKPEWAGKSRPAMFFPKHLYPLARQAKVVSVKAERVQSISDADAIAEGFQLTVSNIVASMVTPLDKAPFSVRWYCNLWDSINAKRGQYAWKLNPWVFATTFEVLPLSES